MRRHVRSPIMWIGGKSRLVDWILPLLDVPCSSYVEVFGGSAAVLLNRQRTPIEVYNDLDESLVTFMLCVREHPGELERLVAGLPYSRAAHRAETEWYRLGCPGRMTDIQRASRWWWLNLSGFGGQIDAGFGTTNTSQHVAAARRRVMTVHEASSRLNNVLIECDDFRTVVERYDSPGTLFYCDPPYAGFEAMYEEGGFSEQDHRDLAALLCQIQGKAAISYYPCSLIDELYPEPLWRRETKAWKSTLMNFNVVPEAEQERTELLLLNYQPPAQGRLGFES